MRTLFRTNFKGIPATLKRMRERIMKQRGKK
jgi:hypothetical protein